MLIFDIGGTFIKYAIVEDGKIIDKAKVATPNGTEIVNCLVNIYNNFKTQYTINHIGISSAGQIDKPTGSIRYAGPTIPKYTGVRLKEELEAITSIPVDVVNDVEACIYNYDNIPNLMYMSLGTGIGGAFKYNQQILDGENGGALEIGHMYHPAGDTFENICSTRSLLEKYTEKSGIIINGEQFDNLIHAGDKLALEIEAEYFTNLTCGIINLRHVLDFNLVIIGGGITEAKFFTVEKIIDRLPLNQYKELLNNLEIKISEYGNDALIYGVYKYISID
ncbi:ROK family protein [Mollicutes bacterium LVI A0039]|nr:ROK family protein [Mollicutes bacterium LVI A0039]